jgi:hypothetical protein
MSYPATHWKPHPFSAMWLPSVNPTGCRTCGFVSSHELHRPENRDAVWALVPIRGSKDNG